MADPAVVVFDTTLRDGEQAPGFSMRVEEKLQLARQLDALGVDIIEAGFPIASQDDAESVRRVATEVRRPVIAALARCAPGDIDCAGKALEPAARSRIHTFIATSDLHLERKLRITREQCLERAVAAVTHARGFTDDVQFSAEDATRSDTGFLYQIVEAVIEAGATTINLPDTVGYCTPDEIRRVLHRHHRRRVPNAAKAIFSTHCHDDLGLAVANSLAAIRAGARQVECTINGIGERAGNASLEEIVMVVARAARPRDVHDRHRHPRDLPVEPAAHEAHRRGGAGQQGDRRPQRLRPRGRHPPGRDAEGPPHLRDHERRRRRRAEVDAGARQALGPPRGAEALRGARVRARRSSSWIASTDR